MNEEEVVMSVSDHGPVSTKNDREKSQTRGRQDTAFAVYEFLNKRLAELVPALAHAEAGDGAYPATRDELEFLTGAVEEIHRLRSLIVERREGLYTYIDILEGKFDE